MDLRHHLFLDRTRQERGLGLDLLVGSLQLASDDLVSQFSKFWDEGLENDPFGTSAGKRGLTYRLHFLPDK